MAKKYIDEILNYEIENEPKNVQIYLWVCDLTQQTLVNELSFDKGAVSKYVSGNYSMSNNFKEAFCEYAGIDKKLLFLPPIVFYFMVCKSNVEKIVKNKDKIRSVRDIDVAILKSFKFDAEYNKQKIVEINFIDQEQNKIKIPDVTYPVEINESIDIRTKTVINDNDASNMQKLNKGINNHIKRIRLSKKFWLSSMLMLVMYIALLIVTFILSYKFKNLYLLVALPCGAVIVFAFIGYKEKQVSLVVNEDIDYCYEIPTERKMPLKLFIVYGMIFIISSIISLAYGLSLINLELEPTQRAIVFVSLVVLVGIGILPGFSTPFKQPQQLTNKFLLQDRLKLISFFSKHHVCFINSLLRYEFL